MGDSRDKHDWSRWENVDGRTVLLGRASSQGRLHGLAAAYVNDFMIAVDEHSLERLSELANVKELYE